jgi:DNA-binding CsgD family transcriptional regulator
VAITDNQRSILLHLIAGLLEREIAQQTGHKPTTIVNTVLHVRELLGARTKYDLMRECLRRGIVTLGDIYTLADTIRPSAADRPPDARG